MSKYNGKQRRALTSCRTETISSCGLTLDHIEGLVGNPAGTGKPDIVNPEYIGKVSFRGDRIVITLKYILTGNISRARIALKNIVDVYAKGGVDIEFSSNAAQHDLRIHGASLIEFT